MSDIAIRVVHLSKRYRLGSRQGRYKTLRDTLTEAILTPVRWAHLAPPTLPPADFIWALQNVSFEIEEGQVVGLIGRNGAGKTTLLKILARITKPTAGQAQVRGRVGSLLEVGTGFHSELTGRENVYLNGAILGMRKAEIDRKFDEIVAFAELEKFIDTPVKFYSSGMQVRLAFAVAAHLEPEILLMDEVLAVGDAAFQKKCLGKMDTVARQGRTILFVSHNLQAISTLTQRTLLLDRGQLVFDGDTYAALGRYRAIWQGDRDSEFVDTSKATGVVRARVITSEPNQIHRFGQPLTFEFEVAFQDKPRSGAFSFQVVDENMKPIMHLWLFDSEQPWSRAGRARLRCVVPKPRLYMGRYSLITHLSDRAAREKIETLEGLCPFEVVMDGIPREYTWLPGACTYLEEATWQVIG